MLRVWKQSVTILGDYVCLLKTPHLISPPFYLVNPDIPAKGFPFSSQVLLKHLPFLSHFTPPPALPLPISFLVSFQLNKKACNGDSWIVRFHKVGRESTSQSAFASLSLSPVTELTRYLKDIPVKWLQHEQSSNKRDAVVREREWERERESHCTILRGKEKKFEFFVICCLPACYSAILTWTVDTGSVSRKSFEGPGPLVVAQLWHPTPTANSFPSIPILSLLLAPLKVKSLPKVTGTHYLPPFILAEHQLRWLFLYAFCSIGGR